MQTNESETTCTGLADRSLYLYVGGFSKRAMLSNKTAWKNSKNIDFHVTPVSTPATKKDTLEMIPI